MSPKVNQFNAAVNMMNRQTFFDNFPEYRRQTGVKHGKES
jgi:hypothetical protein